MKNKFLFSKKTFYLLLLLLCVLPEVIYLKDLGFYWDDWSQLFLHTKFGDTAFPDYFSYNRPLSAWTDMLYFPICGSSPVRWHLLLLLLKTILCILFYKILELTLPENKKLSITAVILFAVCPLFSQYHISIAYTQHFTDFVLFALSILLLSHSLITDEKGKKIIYFSLSVVCTIAHLTITEYFAFLEIIKFPVLCKISKNRGKAKSCLYNTVKYYALHFVIFIIYCLYRLNITSYFPNAGAETPDLLYLFQSSPKLGIHSFLKNLAVDLLYPFTGFLSGLFDFNLQSILTGSELIPVFLSLLISGLVFSYLKSGERAEDISSADAEKPAQQKRCLRFILVCIAGILLGVLPFLIMNENVLNAEDLAHTDRTFLATMPFVCLIFAWLLTVFFPNPKLYAAAACLVVFLFGHQQMSVYLDAKQFTGEQNELYQQLAVRIPGIQDGTAIVDDTIIFPDQGNFATASALNVLYPNPIRDIGDVPVWVFSYPERTRDEHGIFNVQNRIYHFKQPAADYIYIDYDNKYANCVWVFSPEDIDNPHISELQRGWIAGSAIDRIDTEASLIPDAKVFGNTENNWCRYYQQARLLEQKQDWEALANLADTVIAEGFSPSDSRSNSPFEWWPFITGLYRTGNPEKARELADEAIKTDSAYEKFFADRLIAFEEQIN